MQCQELWHQGLPNDPIDIIDISLVEGDIEPRIVVLKEPLTSYNRLQQQFRIPHLDYRSFEIIAEYTVFVCIHWSLGWLGVEEHQLKSSSSMRRVVLSKIPEVELM